jgi:hypothetical protein
MFTMKALLLTTCVAATLAFGLTAADARHGHHRQYYGWHSSGVSMPGRGAFAARPNQCWTDEGYGRRAPCDGRQ